VTIDPTENVEHVRRILRVHDVTRRPLPNFREGFAAVLEDATADEFDATVRVQ
jgi:hypothetical protein